MTSAVQDKHAIQQAQYVSAYHWDDRKRVEARRYLRMTETLVARVAAMAADKNKRALSLIDFGCGDGRSSFLVWRMLRERGIATRLLGVDITEEAIEWAKTKTAHLADEGLDFKNVSLETVLDEAGPHRQADAVIMREVIEHLREEEIDQVFGLIRARLPECGVVITVPSTNSPVDAKHYRHYTPDHLRRTLERNGFTCGEVSGFGFRPAPLYGLLRWLKAKLNKKPLIWRLMNWMWRPMPPALAITLLAVGRVPTPSDRS